jgi:hypothetical protein
MRGSFLVNGQDRVSSNLQCPPHVQQLQVPTAARAMSLSMPLSKTVSSGSGSESCRSVAMRLLEYASDDGAFLSSVRVTFRKLPSWCRIDYAYDSISLNSSSPTMVLVNLKPLGVSHALGLIYLSRRKPASHDCGLSQRTFCT